MAQHDHSIANDTGANVRADINNALSAIVSQNSGASAPTTTFALMWWFDTTNNLLKQRDESDANWVTLGSLVGTTWKPYHGGTETALFETADETKLDGIAAGAEVNPDVVPQAEAEAGTATTERIWTAERVKQAIDALGPASDTQTLAKGWVNFDGTGTLSVRDSFNVTSVTDNGTGDYTINWDTNFALANYSVGTEVTRNIGGTLASDMSQVTAVAVGSYRIRTHNGSSAVDFSYISVVAFGDQ